MRTTIVCQYWDVMWWVTKELTEEEQEADAEEYQDVRNVCNVVVTEQLHLLFSGAHEEEATSIKQERRKVLEAVDLVIVLAIRGDIEGCLVAKDEADFDDPGKTCSHKRIAKDGMYVRAEFEALWVTTHAPSGHHDHDTRNEVTAWTSLAIARKPDADKTGSPPDDAHASVLQVVCNPWASPSVFSESVDASPKTDHQAVPELLASAAPLQKLLAVQEHDREHDAVPYERRAHDEMRSALPNMISTAESLACDSTKDHLYPSSHWHDTSQNSVRLHLVWPDLSQETPLQMQSQVHAQDDLRDEHEHQPISEASVSRICELPALVKMSQEVSQHCDRGSKDLCRDVPS